MRTVASAWGRLAAALVGPRAHRGDPDEAAAWTPERLRRTLHQRLGGERLVILSNREPWAHERSPTGALRAVRPAGGLVTALEPVARACSGVWVAHGSGPADRDAADANGRLRVPPGEDAYGLRRVFLSAEEERGYYHGFANEGLWPLCHVAFTRPVFRAEDFRRYREVNRRFAEAVCEEAGRDDPVVLVQDYHLALAPRFIRERLPRATILSFWHIPWPNADQFEVCPWRAELLEGLLGSDIVGFQTPPHCRSFLDAVDRCLESRTDRDHGAITQGARTTLVRAYPISIDWPTRALESVPPVDACRERVRAELGLRGGVQLGVGVDRLDYTKGIEERLLGVERLLDRHPRYLRRFTFLQLASPSRTTLDRYRLLESSVEQIAARVNDRFGDEAWRPIVLRTAHHAPPEVFRHLRAADVCYVSSLHDGMNLVAKEFVAARDDERGVLVLSRFTGAARELEDALLVNPYDLDEAAEALATALEMPAAQQRERMRAMRAVVAEFNVYRWAGRMIADAARVRGRERLNARLGAEPREEEVA